MQSFSEPKWSPNCNSSKYFCDRYQLFYVCVSCAFYNHHKYHKYSDQDKSWPICNDFPRKFGQVLSLSMRIHFLWYRHHQRDKTDQAGEGIKPESVDGITLAEALAAPQDELEEVGGRPQDELEEVVQYLMRSLVRREVLIRAFSGKYTLYWFFWIQHHTNKNVEMVLSPCYWDLTCQIQYMISYNILLLY